MIITQSQARNKWTVQTSLSQYKLYRPDDTFIPGRFARILEPGNCEASRLPEIEDGRRVICPPTLISYLDNRFHEIGS